MRTMSIAVLALLATAPAAAAEQLMITVNAISEDGVGIAIGHVTATAENGGVLLTPRLTNLPPGTHGFHIHDKPSCAALEKDGKKVAGLAAGGHYDPTQAGRHEGPHGGGHRGDLPVLEVSADGNAIKPVLASKLTLAEVHGRSLMIHAGGDNYSDQPAALGGGGARIACGVIP